MSPSPCPFGLVVDATEEERLVAYGELVEAVQRRSHDDVALDEVAGTAHVRHGSAVAKFAGSLAHVIECAQGDVEELLFLGDLSLVRHGRPSFHLPKSGII